MTKQTFTVGQVLTAAQMTSLQQTAMGGGSTTAKTTSYVLVAADAGTVVQMNAAGATTITVNTALFAAGDTVQIQNVGAGVCTVTAGTATVSTAGSLALSQYEGGQLYFNTTSAALFFDVVQSSGASPLTTKGDLYGFSTLDARVPIGTNNQVLTADSAQALGLKWATPTSGVTWAAYTPTFSEMTVGNATYTARSATSGKLVYFYIIFTLGSTTSFSTYPAFTLPTQPSYRQMFYGAGYDTSAGITYAMSFDNNGTDAIAYLSGLRRPTTYLEVYQAASVPMTWATGDRFYVTGAYEIA